jgi:hypothetical protein
MPSITSQHQDFIPAPLRKIVPYFALVLAVLLVYGNIFDNAFLYDDEYIILKNDFLHDWGAIPHIFVTTLMAGANHVNGFYRPLQISLYLVIYQFFGPSLFAYHFLNIALHAANACLIYRLGRKLSFQAAGCFFAALLWAMHPVNVEAVTYISGTADPLYVLFCLCGLLILVPRFTPKQILLSLPFYLLALLSKEEAIVFPLLAMVCYYLVSENRARAGIYLKFWPYLAIVMLYFVWRDFFLGLGHFQLHAYNDIYVTCIPCRVYAFLATLPSYAGFLLWPVHLHYERGFRFITTPWDIDVLGGFALAAFAIGMAFFWRGKQALVQRWGLLWFAVAHGLHTGILIPVNGFLLEHWLYMPSIGLFLGLGECLASMNWARWRPAGAVVASLLALLLAGMSHAQNTVWRDSETLSTNVLGNGETSLYAHNTLAGIYAQQGKFKEALAQLDYCIKTFEDADPAVEFNYASILLMQPGGVAYRPEAIKHLKRALEIDPDYYSASNALALIYKDMGDMKDSDYYKNMSAAIQRRLQGLPAGG